MSKSVFVDPLEFEDLARHCFDLSEDEDVEQYLTDRAEENGVGDVCHQFVQRLLPMVTVERGVLTNRAYQAFCKVENGCLVALVKTPIEDAV